MAPQTVAHEPSAPKINGHQRVSESALLDPAEESDACLSETQTISLSEQEYDGVVALGESGRVPSETLKRGMARLRQHGL